MFNKIDLNAQGTKYLWLKCTEARLTFYNLGELFNIIILWTNYMFLMRSVAQVYAGLKINRHTTWYTPAAVNPETGGYTLLFIYALAGVRLHPVLRSWPFLWMMPRISGTWSLSPQRRQANKTSFQTGHIDNTQLPMSWGQLPDQAVFYIPYPKPV